MSELSPVLDNIVAVAASSPAGSVEQNVASAGLSEVEQLVESLIAKKSPLASAILNEVLQSQNSSIISVLSSLISSGESKLSSLI